MKKASTLAEATLPMVPSLKALANAPRSTAMLPVVFTPSTEEQRKAAAAAAARRKRRKALVRRNQASRHRQKRVKTSHEFPQATEVSKRPLSSVSPVSMSIQPTVEGMQQVASKLLDGSVVAIPTECTYETAIQLNLQQQVSWSDRIQLLYSFSSSVSNDKSGEVPSAETASAPSGVTMRPSKLVSVCSAASVDEDANSDVSGGDNIQVLPNTKDWSAPAVPHVYVHQGVLEGSFWRKCLPKKPYAVRNKEGEVLAAHAFNESQQLVRLLAAKVWPGPCLIHVAVERSLPGLTVNRHGKHFLALRSLCHPLTVKLYQEFHHQCSSKEGVSKERSSSAPSSPAVTDPILASPGRSPSPVSSNSDFLLVGATLLASNTAAEKTYVTRAEQVGSELTVLNGEESQDIFAVPPCEYGCPCPDALLLDPAQRTVVLCRGDTGADSADSSPRLTAQQLMQTLQVRKAPKTGKDRVIQAVLGRWKVVDEKDWKTVAATAD